MGVGERQGLSTLTITLTLTIRSDSTERTDEADNIYGSWLRVQGEWLKDKDLRA